MSTLGRFKTAQDSPNAGYDSALAELRAGGKRGHWIWYIFPQIGGLGASGMSQMYALDGEEEAAEYLRNPELRSRLLTIAGVVADQLTSGKQKSLPVLMGSHIDAKKIVSSLTLFRHVAQKLHEREGIDDCAALAKVADDVLTAAASQGYPPCAFTLRSIRQNP
jgi:uncharacterized protein (DUF1810 family)